MKKQKIFNDFETLATYNFIGEKNNNNNKTHQINSVKNKENSKVPEYNNKAILPNFLIVSPTSLHEVNNIITSLQNSEPIIVDLTYKKEALTQKVLNYLNGAVFALGGTINKLTNNIYLILPQGANINMQ